jgi:universal stress protein E
MKHVNSILVCVHPDYLDKPLLQRAADIAKKNDAAVKVFHVVSEYPEDMSEWWNVRNPQKLHDKIVSERTVFLDSIAQSLKNAGVQNVTYELRWGTRFLQIIKEVVREKHDLVMITARRPKLSRMLWECPSADLLQHCPCPLWISRGDEPRATKRIVAAIGGAGGNIACDGLNERILRTAAAVAESAESQLHLVHALPVYGGKGVKGKKLRSDLVEFMAKLETTMLEKCSPALEDYDVVLDSERAHVLPGAPETAIAELVASEKMDLVVIGTMGRGGMSGLLVGSTANRVFDQVQCSVLAVKPEGFVSLVEEEEEA